MYIAGTGASCGSTTVPVSGSKVWAATPVSKSDDRADIRMIRRRAAVARRLHYLPLNRKLSKYVALSAFVQRPTFPVPVNVPSSTSNNCWPLKKTVIALP